MTDPLIFGFRPSWAQMRERLICQTDVIQADDGEEQRRSSRQTPRKQYEFPLLADGIERRMAAAQAWSWGGKVWALPIWPDAQELTVGVPAGSNSLNIDTTNRDIAIGSILVLIGPDARQVEAVSVASFTSSHVVLNWGLLNTWGPGTLVVPSRQAVLDDSFNPSQFAHDVAEVNLRFELVEACAWPEVAPSTTYRGIPVITTRPVTTRDPTFEFERLLEKHDDDVGIPTQYDRAGIPLVRQAQDWSLGSRAEIAAFRSLFYWLRGKRGEVWMPTWQSDLVLTNSPTSSSVSLQVERCGYADNLAGSINRRDIRVELVDGTIFYRRITGSSVLSNDTEALTIDTAFGRAVTPSDVLQISFLSLARSDSDIAEIDYFTTDVADVAMTWRGVKRDV